ncbi:MAG: MarR family winged helix-turn-helix transcriptional regulator [Bacteriovoracia bacterium]
MNAFQTLYRAFEEALLKDGCTYSRFQLLFFLYFEGSLAPIELSRKMLVTRSNMSMFLRRMIADGLVTKCPESSSAKRPCYMLTIKGNAFFEKLLPAHIRRVKASMPVLPQDSLQTLKQITIAAI